MEIEEVAPVGTRRALIVGVDHNGVPANEKMAEMKNVGRMAYDCYRLSSLLQNSYAAPIKAEDMMLLCEPLGAETPEWIDGNAGERKRVLDVIKSIEPFLYGRPSRSNVLQALEDLKASTKANDVVYIHFSCHGGDDTEAFCTCFGHTDEEASLCLASEDPNHPMDLTHITRSELAYILPQFPENINLTVSFDCCFGLTIFPPEMLDRTFFLYPGIGSVSATQTTVFEGGSMTRALLWTLGDFEKSQIKVDYSYLAVQKKSSKTYYSSKENMTAELRKKAKEGGKKLENMFTNLQAPEDSRLWIWLQFPSEGKNAEERLEDDRVKHLAIQQEKEASAKVAEAEKRAKDQARFDLSMDDDFLELENMNLGFKKRSPNRSSDQSTEKTHLLQHENGY